MPLINTSVMQRVGGQLGSNPASIFQNNKGQRYYIKTLESPAHVVNEIIAAKLYQLAGAQTLAYVNTKIANQIATEWVELDKTRIAHFNPSERKQAQQWFAVHAWTANWDAAGFDGDNQGLVHGKVITLDLGGALEFRAQGDPKGNAFGRRVNELNIMRRDAGNPHAMRLFADMTREEIEQSVRLVLRIPDEYIYQVIIENGGTHTLAKKMIVRKADIATRLEEGLL